MPIFTPGCHFVPRCRTTMLPATTRSSPNFLTPRRRPSESRPLREEPPAFLCAMTRVPELESVLLDGDRFGESRLGIRGLGRGRLGLPPSAGCLSRAKGLAVERKAADAHHREVLTVAALAARILAAALLEGDNLRAARLLDHLARDDGAGDARSA